MERLSSARGEPYDASDGKRWCEMLGLTQLLRTPVLFVMLACLAGFGAEAGELPPLLLARSYRSGIDLADYWVSEKFDGVRGYWNGKVLVTRGGEVIAAPPWFTQGWPDLPLDGELWAGRGRFARAVSTVRRQQPDDAQWRELRFLVFDVPGSADTFDARRIELERVVAAIGRPWVQAVAQTKVRTHAELHALMKRVVSEGGEGLMLHRGASLYRAERSDDLLKFKPYEDAEARVVAHVAGTGKYAGMVGALLVETPEGRRFRVGGGLPDALRRQPPPLGTWITYRYNGVTDANGVPRFARFLRVRADMPDLQPAPVQ